MPIPEKETLTYFYENGRVISNHPPVLSTQGFSAATKMWPPNQNDLNIRRCVVRYGGL